MIIDKPEQLAKIAGTEILSVEFETDTRLSITKPEWLTGIKIAVRNPSTGKESTIVIRPEVVGYNRTFNSVYPAVYMSAYSGNIPIDELSNYVD